MVRFPLPAACGEQSDDEGETSISETLCCPCLCGLWLCVLGGYFCWDCSSKVKGRIKGPSDDQRQATAWDRKFAEDQYSFKIRHSAAPLPLIEPRQRRLTTSSFEQPMERGTFSLSKKETITKHSQQLQSGLLRLPREIRQMIWNEVVGNPLVHMACMGKKLRHMACQRCPQSCFQYTVCPDAAPLAHESPYGPRDGCTCNLFGIVKTCRKM